MLENLQIAQGRKNASFCQTILESALLDVRCFKMGCEPVSGIEVFLGNNKTKN